jgi:hypothetical protein
MKKYLMLVMAVFFTTASMAQSNARNIKNPKPVKKVMVEMYCEDMKRKKPTTTDRKPKAVIKQK